MDLVQFVNDEFVSRKDLPEFGAGDTITVYTQITEGEKTRTQFFRGVVLPGAEVQVLLRLLLFAR